MCIIRGLFGTATHVYPGFILKQLQRVSGGTKYIPLWVLHPDVKTESSKGKEIQKKDLKE